MVRKTRKQSRNKSNKNQGVKTIPELRRSFEYIEGFVDNLLDVESKDKLVRLLQKEWAKIFLKELDRKSAETFIDLRIKSYNAKKHRRNTIKKRSGGATPIAGAPNDYVTRPGIYLAPGQIPDTHGHLPLSNGNPSTFGSYVEYINKGFWNPEPGQSYDPVSGQPMWPVPPMGMGDNTVHFSSKVGGKRKIRRGGNILSQLYSRPITSSSPPSILQDMQSMWYGKNVGPSPDQIQRGIMHR